MFNEGRCNLIDLRLARDRPTTAPLDSFSIHHILHALTSRHVIIMVIMLFMDGTMLFGLALFLPTNVSDLGYSNASAQLVSVGPYAAAFVS